MKEPHIFIEYYDHKKQAEQELGAFYSVTPDGRGAVIGQNWHAYKVLAANLEEKRVIIPTQYHTITSK